MTPMSFGARVDAWLLRNGVWMLPGVLVLLAVAMAVTARLSISEVDPVRMAVLPHNAAPIRIGSPVPPAQSAAPAESTERLSGTASREGQVEVCGFGWLPVAPDGSPDADLAALPAVSAARRQLVEALTARGDDFVLSAAAGFAFDREPVTRHAELLQLARKAGTSRDPRLYALAWRACRSASQAGGDCALLGIEQWLRLDEGNAVPWLHALDVAVRRGDAPAQAEALRGIAAARRSDERPFALPAAIADLAGTDATGVLAAWTLGVDAIGAASAQPAPFAAAVASCRDAALAEAGRPQACEAIADLLIDRSDSHAAFVAGSEVARQLGRDAARLDIASREVSLGMAEALAPAYDCARLSRDLARWQGGAAMGQVVMLRQRGGKGR